MKYRATLLLFIITGAQALYAADWPMWRYDSYRSACSEEQLPETLTLQWGRQYSPREQVWDDPMNNDMRTYDKVFEPVIMGIPGTVTNGGEISISLSSLAGATRFAES